MTKRAVSFRRLWTGPLRRSPRFGQKSSIKPRLNSVCFYTISQTKVTPGKMAIEKNYSLWPTASRRCCYRFFSTAPHARIVETSEFSATITPRGQTRFSYLIERFRYRPAKKEKKIK